MNAIEYVKRPTEKWLDGNTGPELASYVRGYCHEIATVMVERHSRYGQGLRVPSPAASVFYDLRNAGLGACLMVFGNVV